MVDAEEALADATNEKEGEVPDGSAELFTKLFTKILSEREGEEARLNEKLETVLLTNEKVRLASNAAWEDAALALEKSKGDEAAKPGLMKKAFQRIFATGATVYARAKTALGLTLFICSVAFPPIAAGLLVAGIVASS